LIRFGTNFYLARFGQISGIAYRKRIITIRKLKRKFTISIGTYSFALSINNVCPDERFSGIGIAYDAKDGALWAKRLPVAIRIIMIESTIFFMKYDINF